MEGEHNLLLALVEGVAVAELVDPAAILDEGTILDDPLTGARTDTQSALLGYNGFGWHCLWQSGAASGSATWVAVSSASSAYRLWWGWGGRLYTMELSRAFSNPRQRVATGEQGFTTTGEADLGWFTANMVEFDKLASHVEVNLESCPVGGSVAVDFKLDSPDHDWVPAGIATAAGRSSMPIGWERLADGKVFGTGTDFRRIRFRLRFAGTAAASPILDSLVFKYIKQPLAGDSFTLSIPLDFQEWNGRTPAQIKAQAERAQHQHPVRPRARGRG